MVRWTIGDIAAVHHPCNIYIQYIYVASAFISAANQLCLVPDFSFEIFVAIEPIPKKDGINSDGARKASRGRMAIAEYGLQH